MNHANTTHFFYAALISLTFFTLNCFANIVVIKNKSENPVTVALMMYNGNEFKNSPIQVLDARKQYTFWDTPVEIAPGASLKVNIEIPMALQPFFDKPSFAQIPESIPTYLQVKTKRFIRDKNRYQNATFNIVEGSHNSTSGIWGQKIVAEVVTAIATLGKNAPEFHNLQLIIDENGSPSMESDL